MQGPTSEQTCGVAKPEASGHTLDRREKYDSAREHLMSLFHAHRCSLAVESGGPPCGKEQCQRFRGVVTHMATCALGQGCPEPLCFASKRIVNHWQNCQRPECPLCGPISQHRNNAAAQKIVAGWQKLYPSAKRSMAVKTFVSFVFPDMRGDVSMMDDQRMIKFTQTVKLIEKDLFIKATTVDDYINGLVSKCQKLLQDTQFRASFSSGNRDDSSTSISELKRKFHSDLGLSVTTKTEENGESSSTAAPAAAPPLIKKEESPEDEMKHGSRSSQPPAAPGQNKIWDSQEMSAAFMPLIEQLIQERDAEPFLFPVEELLRIPNYSDIVTNPIDLPTIRTKLIEGRYTSPWQIVDDVWLMFNNAWLFNKKNTRVYKNASKLSEIFETLVNPVMQSMGYCCGREEIFLPQILNCTTMNLCRINRDAVYYQYNNNNKDLGLVMDKYPVCEKCFNDAANCVGIADETTVVNIAKCEFEKMRNSKKEPEPMVYCRECGRKWHQICAGHMDEIWGRGFICPTCVHSIEYKRPSNPYTAAKLPHTKLSSWIEQRVRKYLTRNASENTGEVIIRVLASTDKVVEVKPGMKARYCETGEMPESFPYRVKAIFAFQIIDGQEVCFFGLHVQEYGSESPPPNKRRVYIAYLDSVYFFQPKQLRTAVYHEILVSYLAYARAMKFTMAHIWACPPSEGDDYIFHMHPPDQKIPKPKRLQEWYQAMLKKAQTENIVVDYKDICKDACNNFTVSPTDLPYFEGDYWPNALEEIFKEVDDEDNKRKKDQALFLDEDDEDDDICNGVSPGSSNGGGPNSNQSSQGSAAALKKAKKRKLKKSLTNGSKKKKSTDALGTLDVNQEVSKRVYDMMEKHKDNFFVIRLYSASQAAQLPPIKDPDRMISSELMDSRDTFLNYARDKHLEFSTLRRAKFSTLHMLYDIHNMDKPALYTCNRCSCTLEVRWHCNQCEEFDLCQTCKENYGHDHPLVKLTPEDAKTDERQDSLSSQSNSEKLQKLTQAIAHCINCRDSNCRVHYCRNFKALVTHWKNHGDRNCNMCRRIILCAAFHSKQCQVANCQFPMCPQMKQSLRNSQLQHRAQESKLVRRRMAMMQRSMMTSNQDPAAASTPGASNYPPNGSPSIPVQQPALQSPHAAQQQQHPLSGGKMPHHSPLPASSPYYSGQSPYSQYTAGGGKPSGPSPGPMPNQYAMQQRQLSKSAYQQPSPQMSRYPTGVPPQQQQQQQQQMGYAKSPGQPKMAPGNNVNMADVATVQKWFQMMQTTGQPSVEEFFKCISNNVGYLCAWQYLQSQNPGMPQYPHQTAMAQQALEQQMHQQQQQQQQQAPEMYMNGQQQQQFTRQWSAPQQSPQMMRYRGPPPPQQQAMMKPQPTSQPQHMMPSQQQQQQQQNNPMMRYPPGGPPPMMRMPPGTQQQSFVAPTHMSNATLSQLLSPGQQQQQQQQMSNPYNQQQQQLPPPPYSSYN